VTDIHLALEPCSDGALSWLDGAPVPYPDLAGQISDWEIWRLETVTVAGEWL